MRSAPSSAGGQYANGSSQLRAGDCPRPVAERRCHHLRRFRRRGPTLLCCGLRTEIRNSIAGLRPIQVSSICLVELVYLAEKSRVPAAAAERADEVLRDPSSGFLLAPLDLPVAEAVGRIRREDVPDIRTALLPRGLSPCICRWLLGTALFAPPVFKLSGDDILSLTYSAHIVCKKPAKFMLGLFDYLA